MYKGIFVHVPKAAGTSMMIAFEPHQEDGLITEKTSFLKNPILPLPLNLMFDFKVSRTQVMKSVVGSYAWNHTFKFCFVRNPWDRYVSNWHWLTRTGQRTGWTDRGWKGKDGEITFEDFVHQIGAAYEMPYVCEKIGYPELELPHINYAGYHAGEKKTPQPHYSTHYTPQLRDLVAQRSAADIEAFNYEFESTS